MSVLVRQIGSFLRPIKEDTLFPGNLCSLGQPGLEPSGFVCRHRAEVTE